MAKNERSIKLARNKSTGKIVYADELFDKKSEGFKIRTEFYEEKIQFICCECEQELNISDSKLNRLYFKHNPFHEYCILTDSKLTPKEHDEYLRVIISRESERHKELKNKIGELLSKTEGVDVSSLIIDNKFIFDNEQKKKPDVYCKFHDKEIVFEIQLSQLSLSYILSRYHFYKKKGIYLIWILDNIDIKKQNTLERDIKYLTEYQNFFKLDESSKELKLECDFKKTYIENNEKVKSKWFNKSVSLNELKFDESIFQVYYYNFKKCEREKNIELINIKESLKKRREEKEKQKRIDRDIEKVTEIINDISYNKNNNIINYKEIHWNIFNLDNSGVELLNKRLNLVNRERDGIPILIYWIKNSKLRHDYFLEFLFTCKEIEIDIENKGSSLFQEIVLNEKLNNNFFIKLLLKRGYKVTDEDEKIFLKHEIHNPDYFIIYKICSRLNDKLLFDEVFKFYQLLYTIESARLNKIVGYKLPNWIALANNAIHHHSNYWEYIEFAFKKYGIWEMIISNDKNKVFQKKLENFYKIFPEQEYDFDELFRDLYIDELQYIDYMNSK